MTVPQLLPTSALTWLTNQVVVFSEQCCSCRNLGSVHFARIKTDSVSEPQKRPPHVAQEEGSSRGVRRGVLADHGACECVRRSGRRCLGAAVRRQRLGRRWDTASTFAVRIAAPTASPVANPGVTTAAHQSEQPQQQGGELSARR